MKRIFILLLLLSISGIQNIYASAASNVNSGNRLYKNNKYQDALNKYRSAQIDSPANPTINYNIADALYKTQDYQGAASEYERAISSKNKKLMARSYYNLGNTAYKLQDNDKAIECYKNALRLDHTDKDTKYNLEYLLKVKRENKKQDKNKKNQQNKQEQKDKGDKNKDKENKQGQQQNKNDNNKNQQQNQNDLKQDKDKMSKEDAERILSYFDEADKNAAKKHKMQTPNLPKVEMDW